MLLRETWGGICTLGLFFIFDSLLRFIAKRTRHLYHPKPRIPAAPTSHTQTVVQNSAHQTSNVFFELDPVLYREPLPFLDLNTFGMLSLSPELVRQENVTTQNQTRDVGSVRNLDTSIIPYELSKSSSSLVSVAFFWWLMLPMTVYFVVMVFFLGSFVTVMTDGV